MDDGCGEEKEVAGGSLGRRSGGKRLMRGHLWVNRWLKCRVKGGGVGRHSVVTEQDYMRF
jgi:hypothetical protein